MRRCLIIISTFLYLGLQFNAAQSYRHNNERLDDTENSNESQQLISRRRGSQQHAERNDDSDDFLVTERQQKENDPDKSSNEMVEELYSDLKLMKQYVKQVRPVAKNVRRAMNSRRGLGQEVNILIEFLKKSVLDLLDKADGYLPSLKLVTRHVRKFVKEINTTKKD